MFSKEELEAIKYGADSGKEFPAITVALLVRELERAMKDAERYQKLRKQHWSKNDIAVVMFPKDNVKLGAQCPSMEILDKIIDNLV